MRILVCGSREFSDRNLLAFELGTWGLLACALSKHDVLVHGGCRTGADALAEEWAHEHRVKTEVHNANWDESGRAAGPIRNRQMAQSGVDLCLAFVSGPLDGGTLSMVKEAVAAGVRVVIIPEGT
jgi:SLOG family YspA-like protein